MKVCLDVSLIEVLFLVLNGENGPTKKIAKKINESENKISKNVDSERKGIEGIFLAKAYI